MMTLVDMAANFGIFVEAQNSLLCLETRVFGDLSVRPYYTKSLTAINCIQYSRRSSISLLLRTCKNAVDGFLWPVRNLDLLLF